MKMVIKSKKKTRKYILKEKKTQDAIWGRGKTRKKKKKKDIGDQKNKFITFHEKKLVESIWIGINKQKMKTKWIRKNSMEKNPF